MVINDSGNTGIKLNHYSDIQKYFHKSFSYTTVKLAQLNVCFESLIQLNLIKQCNMSTIALYWTDLIYIDDSKLVCFIRLQTLQDTHCKQWVHLLSKYRALWHLAKNELAQKERNIYKIYFT